MKVVTAIAPINIAVIKYWGKRDESLILPLNGSLSATLDKDYMCAKTTVAACTSFTDDKLWLNGEECSIETDRLQRVLKEIRNRALVSLDLRDSKSVPPSWKVHICSKNNFPTAAGLASSAAGLACLVFALAKLYGVEGDVSDIARLGSGSACRSMLGGFVEWTVGVKSDGSDSIARQIADVTHWSDMAVLILVVNAGKKHTASTSGMRTSVETSQLLRYRAEEVVPRVIVEMSQAITEKNFHKFSELTMKDSNQMHAVCLDSYPPIVYLTDTSRSIMRLVHFINSFFSYNKVAYTFDAGPNACLYLLEEDLPLIVALVKHFFPSKCEENFVRGRPVEVVKSLSQDLLNHIKLDISTDSISYIISTKVGSGPEELPLEESLLDLNTGLPLICD